MHQHTIELLQSQTLTYVPLDLRLLISPDLNPIDYQIPGVYYMPVQDMADLRQCLTAARCKSLWMVGAIDEWRTRL